MIFNKKDVAIGFVIIVLVIVGSLVYKEIKNNNSVTNTEKTPVQINFQQELEDNFKFDIPEDTDVVELKDVSGGNGRGIATSSEILADIEDPQAGYFYQAWLQDINTHDFVSLGKLRVSKGGWLIEFSDKDIEGKKIVVSLEKFFDSKLETKILEGSF